MDTLQLKLALTVGLLICLRPVGACQVNNGKLEKIIRVEEETSIGSVVGSLNFDERESVKRIEIVEDSPFFMYNFTADSFVVKARIDVDRGLDPLQLMIINCVPVAGPELEIEVEFEVEDVNDFSPEFKPSNNYRFLISEAAVAETPVGTVEADDDDRKNQYITFEMPESNYSNVFDIKSLSNGKASIQLIGELDYEAKTEYRLTVIAKDCHMPENCSSGQHTSTADVTVIVTDADDLSPEFTKSDYKVSIFDDAVEGTMVVQALAKDQDEINDRVQYDLDGEGSQFFAIDEYTGMVTVVDAAGIVRGRQYLLRLEAWQTNDVAKKATASLMISIIATNSNAPRFHDDHYTVSVSESSAMDSTVLTLAATDRDTETTDGYFSLDETSALEFTVTESIPSDAPFAVRATGYKTAEIYVTGVIDYETVKTYALTVRVFDGEFMDTAMVTINILDDNDHNPVFTELEYEFTLDWNEQKTVGQVKAFDEDLGENGKVTYKILTYSRLFSIDDNGIVRLAASGDSYTKSEYLINVQAMDSGRSPRTANVVAVITIENLPDVQNQHRGENDSNKDRLVTYIVSGVAGFLLLVVGILIMCLLRRRAKKTASQLRKKDKEQGLRVTTDNNNDLATSQQTFSSEISKIALSDDQNSQTPLHPFNTTTLMGLHDMELQQRHMDTYSYKELSEVGTDDDGRHSQQYYSAANDLSEPRCQASDTEQEYRELAQKSPTSDDNNITVAHQSADQLLKCNSDSGRSSLREDRSPFKQRVPFRSFQCGESGRFDDSEFHSPDDEIAYIERNGSRLAQSNSFNLPIRQKPDIRNLRATEGPPIRSSGFRYFTEAPEGFRSSDRKMTASPFSTTSDYSSSTRTPEIVSSLNDNSRLTASPSQIEGRKRLRSNLGLFYAPNEPLRCNNIPRCTTPDSDSSHDTESTINEDVTTRPQMTIYF